ncbi:hypothetical protein [Streptococcus suis]|uniref:hypothetical protein n=1 Tax=Streptococcus TaxID=1301 RepID=UPI001C93807D|nr:hypothetical protein [Streptococcus suis]MBY5010389.1 hypothetical protein [Streptococcus suis]MDG4518907.1 hypothetical protein [Streptococcus suis]
MKEQFSIDAQGHQLNSLSNYHLQSVISMSIAERLPLESALNTFYYSFERGKYNIYVEKVGLSNYRISNEKLGAILPFTQEEVESAIHEKISREKAECQNVFDEVGKSWKENSKLFYDNLKEEDPNQFFNWALKEVENSNTFGCLSGIILSCLGGLFLFYLVYYFLYGHSPIEYLGWITEPLRYFLSGNTPYEGYYTAVLLFFLGFIFLSFVSLIVMLPLNRKLFINPQIELLARKKAKQVAKERYNKSKELLREYHQDFSGFYVNDIFQQLIPSAIPKDYYYPLSKKYKAAIDLMFELRSWESSFSKETFDTVFEQYREYQEVFSEYIIRLKNGSSMLAQIPTTYHESEKLSKIWMLLNEGRADTWKESVNLMRTDAFQESMLEAIRNTYQSVERLTNQLYIQGQELRTTLEQSILQQQKHFESIESSNRQRNHLLAKNNELIESQNIITSNLLIAELITK